MNRGHALNNLLCLLLMALTVSQVAMAQFVPGEWKIPANANSYITTYGDTTHLHDTDWKKAPMAQVGRSGLMLKNDTQSVASAYVYIVNPAQPDLSLYVLGEGKLSVTCEGQEFTVNIRTEKWQKVKVGQLNIREPHYIRIDFQLKHNAETSFIIIRDIILSNLPVKPVFVNNNFSDYFGRRGPSVHFRYSDKAVPEADWAVSDLTVTEGSDVEGSFFCPIDFENGIFGLQNISENERWVILSIWNFIDPESHRNIPADSRTRLVEKAPEAYVRTVEENGLVMQCYLKYNWKTGVNYRLALHAEHAEADATDYSAYFYDPEKDTWIYIATVRRPQTPYLISRAYSFVENVVPEEGYRSREATFGPMWLHGTQDKQWHSITRAKFSYDDTGRRGGRVDFFGGVKDDRFFLKMGGFFCNGSAISGEFDIPAPDSKQPPVDIEKLLSN
jgi:hypothetical protein